MEFKGQVRDRTKDRRQVSLWHYEMFHEIEESVSAK
jgi:hypothetical protein